MSNIDPTKPIAGTPTTQSVRDNFAAAVAELDLLTAAVLPVSVAVSFTAVAGNTYDADTSAASITATFPASASVGDRFLVINSNLSYNAFPIILDPNGLKIQGITSAITYARAGASLEFFYTGAAYGWAARSILADFSLSYQTAFDPSKAGQGIALTNDNRVLAETRGGWTMARSNSGRNSGKHYAEFFSTGSYSTGVACGLVDATAAPGSGMNNACGALVNGYAVASTSSSTPGCAIYDTGSGTPSGACAGYIVNQRAGFAFDADAHTIGFYIDGSLIFTWSGVEATTFFPAGATYDFTARINLPQEILYLPSGFAPWI